ncbi:hypothetical protein NEOC84_000006|nr:hypothetical protein [Neochlamydia sp. AcF84]
MVKNISEAAISLHQVQFILTFFSKIFANALNSLEEIFYKGKKLVKLRQSIHQSLKILCFLLKKSA